ncbi:hypothetical protein OF83DRAFT_1169907 [Amylostereum chailletii]|nr:hypothetical protein OF83DRAFT_1169907 [Amylostereum chailletii]
MLQPQSSRPWWSRSTSIPKNYPNEKPTNGTGKQGKKLNNLASAIGLKPRKHTLTIQEPPSPTLPLHTGSLEPYPPSIHGLSSAYPSWDEAEPRTPSDLQKHHISYAQSVLTTSEMDPFASQYLPSPPGAPEDARYSVFSDSSTSDSHALQSDFTLNYNRESMTSSSDQSHSKPLTHLSPPLSPRSLPFDHQRASRLTVASDKIIRREPPFMPSSASPVSPYAPGRPWDERPQIRPSLSSSTLTDKARAKAKAVDVDRPPVPRLKTRPRGMTDVGPSRSKGSTSAFDTRLLPLHTPPDVSPTNPLVLVRQPSRTKLVPSPIAPPPTAGLPPTPPTDPRRDPPLGAHLREPSPTSASSSSSVSFASTTSSRRDHGAQRFDPRERRHHDSSSRTAPPSPSVWNGSGWAGTPPATVTQYDRRPEPSARPLKKAVSSHHLQSSIASSASTSSTTVEDVRSVKKQRSFHHTRMIALPPLPSSLRHTNSSGSVPQSHPPTSPPPRDDAFSRSPTTVEQRRGSATSQSIHSPPSGRRRLFSGTSLRRSLSSQAASAADDETHSVFSASDDRDRPGFNNPFSASSTSSFWDDGDMPSSPGQRPHEFSPQHIMAPADMLRLEALVQNERSTAEFMRSRGQSFTSVSTSFSNAFSDAMSSEEMSLPSSRSSRFGEFTSSHHPAARLSQQPFRSDTFPSSPTRPRPATVHNDNTQYVRPSESQSAGLPPPPRPRSRPAPSASSSQPQSHKRTSVAPITPLSPPPSWKNNGRRAQNKPPPVVPVTVPREAGRPAILRKPSFLEIDDEVDRKKRPIAADKPAAPADSFLDLGKSSFDTIRSSLENDFGPN